MRTNIKCTIKWVYFFGLFFENVRVSHQQIKRDNKYWFYDGKNVFYSRYNSLFLRTFSLEFAHRSKTKQDTGNPGKVIKTLSSIGSIIQQQTECIKIII